MTARDVKDALHGRHPGNGGQFPGPWTCVEEYRGIDLLAFSAWSSASGVRGVHYPRVGYEVKVSRSDLRRELLRPHKRARAVSWCHAFYFAFPAGLLTADELAYEEPAWEPEDFVPVPCPGYGGKPCSRGWGRRTSRRVVEVPVPAVLSYTHDRSGWRHVPCPTCQGTGKIGPSRAEREAPQLWIPKDVGAVAIDGRGTTILRPSPVRKEVPVLHDHELAQLVRWVSMRSDPRHHPARLRPANDEERVALEATN